MSPWQMNGEAGLVEAATHALCGLFLPVFISEGELAPLSFDHRTYCNTEEKHEHRHLTQIQAIKLFMTGRRPQLNCEARLSLFD